MGQVLTPLLGRSGEDGQELLGGLGRQVHSRGG